MYKEKNQYVFVQLWKITHYNEDLNPQIFSNFDTQDLNYIKF